MTAVKICGVMDREAALVALEAGADMLGFVLAPSRRQIPPEAAAGIIHEVRRRLPPAERPWLAVGVFANQPLEFVQAAAALAKLDVVQLSGEEAPEYSRSLDTPVYKALHLGGATDVGRGMKPRRPGEPPGGHAMPVMLSAAKHLLGPSETRSHDYLETLRSAQGDSSGGVSIPSFRRTHRAERVLLDSGGTGAWGGTGRPFQWHLIGDAARDCLVAGGLSPGNVADAIALLRPWGVDVSSGVERDGRKDPDLIRAFISESRGGNDHERER